MVLEFMTPGKMTDAGMYVWAGILAVAALASSWLLAGWWQRRKERQKERA